MVAVPSDRPEGAPKRRYNSARRSLQAAQTRSEVLDAAVRLFTTSGWTGTTIGAVAAEAGVSVETVYAGFGSKKRLLRAAMDAAVVGDADPVPFIDRDTFASLGRGQLEDRLHAATQVMADIHERSAGVWRAIMEAAVGDPDVDGWRRELEAGRRLDLGRSIAAMLGAPPDEITLDMLWALFGPEVYLKLTLDAGRTRAQYEAYVRETFTRLMPTASVAIAAGNERRNATKARGGQATGGGRRSPGS